MPDSWSFCCFGIKVSWISWFIPLQRWMGELLKKRSSKEAIEMMSRVILYYGLDLLELRNPLS